MPARNLIAGGAPAFPKFFIYIIGLILLLSAAVLALAAYAESLSGHYYYDSNVTSFLLFISSWTWLAYGGMLSIQHYAPRLYYRAAVLVVQILSVIFWIIGWAWAASWAASVLSFDNYGSYDSIRGAWKAFGQITAACAGLGALAWVMCIIALVVFCSACGHGLATLPRENIELANASKSNTPQRHVAFPPS